MLALLHGEGEEPMAAMMDAPFPMVMDEDDGDDDDDDDNEEEQ